MSAPSSRFTSLLLIALLVAALPASGCRSARRGEPLAGEMDLSDPAVERGAVLFARHCHACHPGGEAGLGPALNDKPLPRFLMRLQVRHGLGVMPSLPKATLSDGKLDDLLAFVVARRRHGG